MSSTKENKREKAEWKTSYLIHTNNDFGHHSDENAPPKKLGKKKKKFNYWTHSQGIQESQQRDYNKTLFADRHKDGEKVQRTQSFIVLPISSEFIIFPDKE